MAGVLVGITPLELILKVVTIKFILKSLSKKDDMTSRIFQVEETPAHEFYQQIHFTKMYLLWNFKRGNISSLPTTIRNLNLCEIDPSKFYYDNVTIKTFECEEWNTLLKHNTSGLMNRDPFCIEPLLSS